jgi:hypothetical protein
VGQAIALEKRLRLHLNLLRNFLSPTQEMATDRQQPFTKPRTIGNSTLLNKAKYHFNPLKGKR